MGSRSECQKWRWESKRRLPRRKASEDRRVSEAVPSDWNGIGGVQSQGSLLGSCEGDGVCGLLWPFCFLFLFFSVCSERSQGNRKSRSLLCPQLLDWGLRPWVIGRDDTPTVGAAEKHRPTQQEKGGGRGRKWERRTGRRWASKAVFLLRTFYKLRNRESMWAILRPRALQTHTGAKTLPPAPEGGKTPQLPSRGIRKRWRVHKYSRRQSSAIPKPQGTINPNPR